MNDTTTPRPTVREAAHKLWELFFWTCTGAHPYVACVTIGGDAIYVVLYREPLPHEQQIPTEWMGWPVAARVTGRMQMY